MCASVCVYARGAREVGYALCVVVVLFMASWQEAHVSCWTGHNRSVNVCDGMRVVVETVFGCTTEESG
jgi:hypothetical protein